MAKSINRISVIKERNYCNQVPSAFFYLQLTLYWTAGTGLEIFPIFSFIGYALRTGRGKERLRGKVRWRADLFKVHWIIVPIGDFNDRREQAQSERNLTSTFNERFNRVHSLDKEEHDLFIVIDVYLSTLNKKKERNSRWKRIDAMIDRFKHVQCSIMINDATYRSKNLETLSAVSERGMLRIALCFRYSFGTRTIYGPR